MKTLIIYPGSKTYHDTVFSLLDPVTGEGLASHFCSGSYYAKSDLHDGKSGRLKTWEEKFGEKTEAKFIDETDYNWEDINKKNLEFHSNEEI